MSFPLGPIFGSADDTTGSIPAREARFSPTMSDADWTLAKAALAGALDAPAGTAPGVFASVDGRLSGTVAPVAGPWSATGQTCRAFVASMVEAGTTRWLQGHACRDAAASGPAAPWTVANLSAWTPPAAR